MPGAVSYTHLGEGQTGSVDDLLWHQGRGVWIEGKRIANPNSHGTGCTLSSAIASNLAKGFCMEESVRRAKMYLSGALTAGLDLGKGSGPLDHGYCVEEFTPSGRGDYRVK